MCPKDKPSPEDIALFRRTVGAVKQVLDDRVPAPHRRPAPLPRFTAADEAQVLADSLSDGYDPGELETGEELWFLRPGLQHTVLRRLRRGHYAVEAELDLHGMTVPVARAAVAAFLQEARSAGRRCVRIIHGKGRGSHQRTPVLKQKLNGWLRQWDDVLAFCSARPVDGGTGAIYLLLKRGAP